MSQSRDSRCKGCLRLESIDGIFATRQERCMFYRFQTIQLVSHYLFRKIATKATFLRVLVQMISASQRKLTEIGEGCHYEDGTNDP
jgi:hypothetical protein